MADVTSRLSTALADRYVVQRELGRGGMARVFLAEEQHPKRHVAIKVLDPEIAAVLGPERFLREVDLASKLAHRHITPVHAARDATDQANDPRSSSLMNLQQLPLHADMP
jgi:serine/threonine-protein kinase